MKNYKKKESVLTTISSIRTAVVKKWCYVPSVIFEGNMNSNTDIE